MLFAIEEINNSTDILPGVSLGYKIYDACGSIAQGVRVALALANSNEAKFAPSQTPCSKPAQVQAIMGETSSSPCMAIATVIGPFHIPLVGKRSICFQAHADYKFCWSAVFCLRLSIYTGIVQHCSFVLRSATLLLVRVSVTKPSTLRFWERFPATTTRAELWHS